jgi:hypothetical protein
VFYGEPAAGRFTEENVYWLQEGEAPGRRWADRASQSVGGQEPAASFEATQREERNLQYRSLSPSEVQEPWYWERLSARSTFTHTFDIGHLAVSDAVQLLRYQLVGRTNDPVTPDHHTLVSLNGQVLDEAWWEGQELFKRTLILPPGLLQESGNSLSVGNVGDTGAAADSIYVDWFEIIYPRQFVAEDDRLHFFSPETGAAEYQVTGFSTSDIRVLDITDPAEVVRISGPVITTSEDAHSVRFRDEGGEAATYLAYAEAARMSPHSLGVDSPSSWRSVAHSADYIIVTHHSFLDAAHRLAEFHQGRGMQVAVVDVQDIYDEFNHGIFHPGAIRDFLAHAYHEWQEPAPAYVLLLGDASRDYKDYLGLGEGNFVPTHLFETAFLGETPADSWFVAVDGDDDLPDLLIGRLPARTPEDAAAVVDKTIAYAEAADHEEWHGRALFVADDDEEAFSEVCEDMVSYLPSHYVSQRLYVTDYEESADPRGDIIDAFDTGVAAVSYVGHGNVDLWGSWAGGRIFQKDDIADLDNAARLPFVYVATCLNGYFVHPTNVRSLSEEFVLAPGRGAIATWSPAGLTYTGLARILSQELFRALYTERDHVLGSATTAAKIATYARTASAWEMVQHFVLLGDPATELHRRRRSLFLPTVLRGDR